MKTAECTPSAGQREALLQRYLGFPSLTYDEFLTLPEELRRVMVSNNRILQTDTYNRTMNHIKGEDWKKEETYILQLRKATDGYLIAHGIRVQLEKIASIRITEEEFQFAREFYSRANVKFFNEEMWRYILDECGGALPLKIDAVQDGTALLSGDPVIRVTGPGEIAAHFEPDMHRVFYETLVATTAHEIATKIGVNRFIEVGKRGTPNEEMHLQATAAMYSGGGLFFTSNDAAAACYPQLKDVGTLGHRFIQFYDSEDAAFRKAVVETNTTSLLIDLTDSYRGIEKALALKQEFRHTGKKIWIRLDSGNITEQTLYVLRRFQELGFTDPVLDKVVVEDLSTVDDMVKIDQAVRLAGYDEQKHVLYGAGGLLVTRNKARSDASSGYKLSAVESEDKIKFSDSPGKESLPGQATLVFDGVRRIIAKVGEFRDAEDLLIPAYRDGEILFQEDRSAVRARVEKTFRQIESQIGMKSDKSEKIMEATARLAEKYEVS